jgi:hypothetical protein
MVDQLFGPNTSQKGGLTHRMPCSGNIKAKKPISLTTPQILRLLFIAPVLLLLFCPCFTAPVPAPELTGPPLDPAYSSLHGAVATRFEDF